MPTTSTREVIKATEIHRESASGLSARYGDLLSTSADDIHAALIESGVTPNAAARMVADASEALLMAAAAYDKVFAAVTQVASTMGAIERAKLAAEADSPTGKFVIN